MTGVQTCALPICSLVRALIVGTAIVASACGGGSAPPPASSTPAPTAVPTNVSTDKNSYPVFPNADTGADPAVPAAQGGKGFTGEGWQTNTAFDLIGDPHAVKGGVFRIAVGIGLEELERHYAEQAAKKGDKTE